MDKRQDFAPYLPAAQQALKSFPIEADCVEPLAVGENVVFRVTDIRGDKFVMRLHRPGYHTLEELNSERLWTAALNDGGLGAPHGVRALNGDWYVSIPTPDLQGSRLVGITKWSEGEIFSDVISRDGPDAAFGHYARLGEFVARMHNQSAKWLAPPGFSRHSLDREGLIGEVPFWGRFWESGLLSTDERGLVASARLVISEHLQVLSSTSDAYSLIHADLHPGNVLVDAGQLSVIDFDDAAFGWHAYDAAVALFDAWERPTYPLLRDAFLSGYRSERPDMRNLPDVLPLFLLIRGLMHISWLEQRPELDPIPFMNTWHSRLISECEALLSN